jgi:putative sigma-54 modulation protein
MYRQIVRYKGKRIDRWHGQQNNKRPPEEPMPELDQDVLNAIAEEGEHRIVRTKHFFVNPMTEDEAAEQMELLGHDFFVFYNPNVGRINVIYRRGDGNYGVLDPEVA